MRKSDFRSDRDNNYDPTPTEEMSLREKLEYQRKIRKAWEVAELPSDLPWIPMDAEWWETPNSISPEQQQAIITKQMKRFLRNG